MFAIYTSYCTISVCWVAAPVYLWSTPEWTDWWDLLFVSRDSSNYSAVLCMCFQIAVCPHPIGRVLYTCIA